MQPKREEAENTVRLKTFKAERISLNHESHEEELRSEDHGHGNEMLWLVGYSDMMTLLFGFFVILFSLASSSRGKIDQVMQDVSQNYFGGKMNRNSQSAAVLTSASTNSDLRNEIDQLKIAKAAQKESMQSAWDAVDENKKKVTEKEKEIAALEANLNKQKQEMATALALAEAQKKKQIAALEANLNKQKQEMATALALAETQNEKQIATGETLQKSLDAAKSDASIKNFMATMLIWNTEKHDLDLSIQDPDGNTFDFKHRKIQDQPGRFELDSRFGPGIEMWRAENFKPGDYIARVRFYSRNGNDKPAQAHLTITTNLSTYQSPSVKLIQVLDEAKILFHIYPNGEVEFRK